MNLIAGLRAKSRENIDLLRLAPRDMAIEALTLLLHNAACDGVSLALTEPGKIVDQLTNGLNTTSPDPRTDEEREAEEAREFNADRRGWAKAHDRGVD